MDGGVRLERGRGESSYYFLALVFLALILLDRVRTHPPDRVRTHPPDRVRTHPPGVDLSEATPCCRAGGLG